MQSSFSIELCTEGANLMKYSLGWALISFVLDQMCMNSDIVKVLNGVIAYRIYISKTFGGSKRRLNLIDTK